MVGILFGLVAGLALGPSAASAVVPGGEGKVAFTSNRGGSRQIYAMDADGSNQAQLTSGLDSAGGASWSPDGSKIAFIGTVGIITDVYVMNADGSGQRRLGATGTFVRSDAPAWSPDGQKIAFVKGSTTFVINADGTKEYRLNTSWAGGMGRPDWSPDGASIVFDGLPTGEQQFGIFVINADGTGSVRRLTAARDTSAAWSPDGRIAYNRSPLGLASDVFVMNADGSAVTNLTNTDVQESEPAWSPDGKKIAFHQDPRTNNLDIYTINADGTGKTRLTTDAGNDTAPNWQPLHPTLDGTPPTTILCGFGDRTWSAADVRTGCSKPKIRLPVVKAAAASG